MAACYSSPLCAPVGLLLLLLGVFSSHLPEVQARPTDFWCNYQERKKMEQRNLEELKKDMLQQKRAEVLGALQVLQDGVRVAISQTTLQCQSSLLKKLEHRIMNHLLIVNQIQIQNDMVIPSESTAQVSTSQTSLKKVLEQYGKLLTGKLEYLAIDLKGSICKV